MIIGVDWLLDFALKGRNICLIPFTILNKYWVPADNYVIFENFS
jgi:hypothetical protein